jgi:DNA gyrase inhibitor GyrI
MPAAERLDQPPAPARQDVRLIELSARRTAAIRFSGTTSDERIQAREAALCAWLAARGLSPVSAPTDADYNDPLRRGCSGAMRC